MEDNQPRPVFDSAKWVALIMALVAMLGAFGYIAWSDEQSDAFRTFIVLAIPMLPAIAGPLLVWWRSERKVTPIASPRDNDLVPLVRADGKDIVQ